MVGIINEILHFLTVLIQVNKVWVHILSWKLKGS